MEKSRISQEVDFQSSTPRHVTSDSKELPISADDVVGRDEKPLISSTRQTRRVAVRTGFDISTWDTTIVMVPFIGLMIMAMFGQDEHLASTKPPVPRRHKFCEVAGDGTLSLLDPDGRPTPKAEPRK